MKKDRIIRCQLNNTRVWFFMSAKGVMNKSIDKGERLTIDQAEKRMKELQENFPNATFQTISAPASHDADAEETIVVPPRTRSATPAENKA